MMTRSCVSRELDASQVISEVKCSAVNSRRLKNSSTCDMLKIIIAFSMTKML